MASTGLNGRADRIFALPFYVLPFILKHYYGLEKKYIGNNWQYADDPA